MLLKNKEYLLTQEKENKEYEKREKGFIDHLVP